MAKIVLTNDDGVMADGLRALHRALVARGLDVVVVAPTDNRSGVSRNATYSDPVSVTPVEGDESILACSGTPVDCVRAALLGDIAPDAALVLSGMNHGANLGDDILNSGTVGAAIEGALLGVPAIAVSQHSHPGFFHILDALDQSTPVYDETADIGALFAASAIRWDDWPDRLRNPHGLEACSSWGRADFLPTRPPAQRGPRPQSPPGLHDINVRRDAHHRGINDLEGENGERRTCRRRARTELELEQR